MNYAQIWNSFHCLLGNVLIQLQEDLAKHVCTCTFYIHILSQCKCSHMTHLACALPLFVCHVSSAGTDWPALFRCLRTNQARAQFGGHGAHQLLPIIVIHVCSQKNISGSPQHTNIHIRRTLRIKSTRYLMSRQIGYIYVNRCMCI